MRNSLVEVVRAELSFYLAAVFLLLAMFLYLPILEITQRNCAWWFTLATLGFWSLSFRAYALILPALALGGEQVSKPLLRILGGVMLKGALILTVVYLFRTFGSCGAKWFVFMTILQLFLASIFLVVFTLISEKNK